MITIHNLQKNFGDKKAVDIDNYIINQGDMLGLVGNNGAGKTTLFRLMLDLLKADNIPRKVNCYCLFFFFLPRSPTPTPVISASAPIPR